MVRLEGISGEAGSAEFEAGNLTMTTPRIRWGIAAAALVCLAALTAWAAPADPDTRVLELNDKLVSQWGDSPQDDQGRFLWLTEEPTGPTWLDWVTATDTRPADHDDIAWTRLRIPEGTWQQPILYLPQVLVAFEAYLDTTLIYRSGDFTPSNANKFTSMISHLIPLPENPGGSVLSFRIYSPYRKFIGINTMQHQVLLGAQADIFRKLFFANVDSLILGSLFFFAGLISLVIFLRRLRYRIWFLLSFAWLTCNIGAFYVLNDAITMLMGIPAPLAYYVGLISFAAFPVGIYTFLEQIIGKHLVLRWLWRIHLIYLAVAIPLDLLDIVWLSESGMYYSTGFAISILIGLGIVGQASVHGRREVQVFAVGFFVFALSGVHDLLAGMGVFPLWNWLSHWGMLVLIMCLSYIVEQTYSNNLRQLRLAAKELAAKTDALEEYSVTLEQRVENRTRDLAEKNEHLVETMLELKEAQAQMLVQDKMASLGNLVAGVAHEMNTPLGAVVSAADVEARCIDILDKEVDGCTDIEGLRSSSRFQKARRSLLESNAVLKTGSKRIMTIMSSLRSFARLDEAIFQEVNLHEGIDSTITLLQHDLKNRIEVVRDFGALPLVGCNANQINQVFMNVLMNAAQAIEGPGTITIQTTQAGGHAVIRVTDTGPGISPADQKKIFDPGFTTKGVGVGTGLGLSICYKIVEGHGGEIIVDSEPDRGTTIEIRLPLTRP